MPVTEEQAKEYFSKAVVRALAASLRLNEQRPEYDMESEDLTFTASPDVGLASAPRVTLQLKASTQPAQFRELVVNRGHFSYRLKKKNYDDLRTRTYEPAFLVVVHIIGARDRWLTFNPQSIMLHSVAYFFDLRGLGPLAVGATGVSLHIPFANQLNRDVMLGWFQEAEAQCHAVHGFLAGRP